MSRFDKNSVFAFSCNSHLWRYWVSILPQIAYAGQGYTHNELIDEAVLFACNCLCPPPAAEYDKPQPLQFRKDLWNAMTGFEEILSACYALSEVLEDQIDESRGRAIYMEAGLRARDDYAERQESKSAATGSVEKTKEPRKTSATMDDIKSIEMPFRSSLSTAGICAAIRNHGCKYLLERETATVRLTHHTMYKLTLLLDYYNLRPAEATLTIMSLVQIYLPLIEGYTNSLTDDLISRRSACENLAEQCHKLFSKLQTHCNASAHYTQLMAERLSTLGHGLSTGQTLLDKFLKELTPREDPEADFTKHTELDHNEYIWGKHAL
ncbi:hypothetical protein QEH59_11715 [Coraliomargarita sp. SDUM461004]|uniref:Uncharacterized protein n=1 Tax=Thalassobacterium sedimentorum TaxID=3041258 RepID=A0ABU1AMV0_9BACT|nr:hypothetical protein [Coraliomargarita sp. SDUM461004]